MSPSRIVCAFFPLAVLALPSPVLAHRIPCTDVLSELDHIVSQPGVTTPDPLKVARRLETEPSWVERCAALYGRRVKRDVPTHGLTREEEEERWESEEPEEQAPEDKEARGENYFPQLENDAKDRRELKRFNADSSNEWDIQEQKPWEPDTGKEWTPFLHDK